MVGAGFAQQAAAAPPAVSPGAAAEQVNQRALATRVTFDGPYQAGILTPKPDEATFVALDSVAPNRAVLFEALQALSTEARLLTQGDTVGLAEIDDPPPDSGILGPVDSPDSLTVTIALGGSLFDGRYGLAAARPRHLTPMPVFANDELDPARTGGDLLLQICAGQRDTVIHTFRELMRAVDGRLVVRWTIDGFQSAQRGPSVKNNRRNLFAFRDGTVKPRRHRSGEDEPADLGRAWQRRAGLGDRRDVRHRPHDPHARRVLGPRRDARAGADDRP